MSFLAIDVGNSRLKWALYEAAHPQARLEQSGAVPLERIDNIYESGWRAHASPTQMLGCVVAGEAIRARVEEQLLLWGVAARWVKSQPLAAGLANTYEHPGQLGADRWLAMIGALHYGRAAPATRVPLVVTMVGTAVTVDAIDAQARFVGGLILPGFGLMLRALELGTAGLRVPSGEVRDFPLNTSDALMSGGSDAIVGAIERMCARLQLRTGQAPRLIISGGAATKLNGLMTRPFELVDTLIFQGLLQVQAAGLGPP